MRVIHKAALALAVLVVELLTLGDLEVSSRKSWLRPTTECADAVQWWNTQRVSFAVCCFFSPPATCFDQDHTEACCYRDQGRLTFLQPVIGLIESRAKCEITLNKMPQQILLYFAAMPVVCSVQSYGHVAILAFAVMNTLYASSKSWAFATIRDQTFIGAYVTSKDVAFGQDLLDPAAQSLLILKPWSAPVISGLLGNVSSEHRIARTASEYRVGAHLYSDCIATCELSIPSPNCMDLRPLLFAMPSRDLTIINIGCHGVLLELDDAQGWMHDPITSLVSNPNGKVRGLFVDANWQSVQDTRAVVRARNLSVDVDHVRVTPENVNALVEPYGQIDVLKIDIDTFDCAVILSLLRHSSIRPFVLVIELQPKVPPPFRYSLHPDVSFPKAAWPTFQWQSASFPSCSISYAVHHLLPFYYFLYKYNGENAIFIHKAVAEKVALVEEIHFPIDEFFCYFQAPIYDTFPLEYVLDWAHDDPAAAFGKIWHNITAVHLHANVHAPFTLDF